MPLFYHYTDGEGVENIIRTGKIMASLSFMSGGDTAFGNGVYLTKLNPETSTKIEIARNNWVNTSAQFIKKTENYFVVDIPESDVKDTNATDRNIFLFGSQNDLRLHKYHWWLKNFDSNQIIASYKYIMISFGPASSLTFYMNAYNMTEETVNGRPVYKNSSEKYLCMNSKGSWMVGPHAGGDRGRLHQISNNYSLGPDTNLPWKYGSLADNLWHKDDSTLKAHAWQM